MAEVFLGARTYNKIELLNLIGKLKRLTTPNERKRLDELIKKRYYYHEVHHDCDSVQDNLWQLILPALDNNGERVLVALNQADIAMRGGNHWDYETNQPDEILEQHLQDKLRSINARIKAETGVNLCLICYCAGYKEQGRPQRRPYNLTKLLYYIVRQMSGDKRMAFVGNLNENEDYWKDDDQESDYKVQTFRSIAISETRICTG